MFTMKYFYLCLMKYCDSTIIYNLQPEWKWHIFLLRKQQVCHQTGAIEALESEPRIDGIINWRAGIVMLLISQYGFMSHSGWSDTVATSLRLHHKDQTQESAV